MTENFDRDEIGRKRGDGRDEEKEMRKGKGGKERRGKREEGRRGNRDIKEGEGEEEK